MATPRLSTFYTNFFRAVRSCEPTTYHSLRSTSYSKSQIRNTVGRRSQSTFQNRYGPAATEGLPPPPKPQDLPEIKQSESQKSGGKKKAEVVKDDLESESQKRDGKAEVESKERDESSTESTDNHQTIESKAAIAAAAESESKPEARPELTESLPNRELDLVLSVPSPNELKGQASRHPHLEPSPYEHHFDTYGSVQELATPPESFSEEQAVTLMKAIRLMLANNLDIAKEGLVSKSDVENESYLFRAACSELRTTLQSSRFAEYQRQRSNRAQLQHEFDILNQKVSQDILTMKEELKGMFNDRKMGLQEEKRKIDSEISELNYEITVLLNSEAKGEVESLRWVLTRRAAMAIGVAAFMTLSALQYYSIKSRESVEMEKRKQAAQKAQEEKMKDTEIARYTTPSRSSGTQTDGLVEESLG